jgi:hypothetical protein
MNDGGGRGGKGVVALFLKKKQEKKINVSTQKAHKFCHQFERRIVRVGTIDLFKGAGSLLEILGRWLSRGAIGHCVAGFQNFVPLRPVSVYGDVKKKKSI